MPGYHLIQATAPGTEGVTPDKDEMGVLDFLREIAADPLPLPRYFEVRVVGLEEVLFASRPEEAVLALEIHRHLRHAAPALERQLVSVQVVFRGELVRGDSLRSEFRGQRLPIGHIFGAPTAEADRRGNRSYRVNFNLTAS
jgi:hypothetical protein